MTTKSQLTIAAVALAAAAFGHCARPGKLASSGADTLAAPIPSTPAQTESSSAGPGADRSPRPEAIQDSIQLEGMPERINAKLFDSSRVGLPVHFTTYIPSDLLVDAGGSSRGKSVRLVANFAGHRNDNVYVELVFLPAGTTEQQARTRTRATADKRGWVARADTTKRYPWSIAEEGFSKKVAEHHLGGTVVLGRHGDRFFHLVIQNEEEYAEGFLPRVAYVLSHWRWEDTGTPLF